jgi:hypothetical protein
MAVVTGSFRPQGSFGYAPANALASGNALAVPLTLQSLFTQAGVAANEVDTLYAEPLTVPAGGNVQVNLQSFADFAGIPATSLARVRFLAVQHLTAQDGLLLTVGAAATDPWDGLAAAGAAVKVYPPALLGATPNGGWTIFSMAAATGAPVTSTTNILQVNNPGATAVSAVLVIAGCSA